MSDARLVQPFEPGSVWLYRFGRMLFSIAFRLGWRLRVDGLEHVPRTGPLIVAPNHCSYADPPLVGVAMPRDVHFLAKQELFRFWGFGSLIRRVNAHPLHRAGGAGAIKAAQALLKAGFAVLVFPEGRRVRTGRLEPAKAGVGLLAIKAQAPVVPAYVHNSAFMPRFRQLRVVFGPPVYPEGFSTYQDLADEVMRRVAEMKKMVERHEENN